MRTGSLAVVLGVGALIAAAPAWAAPADDADDAPSTARAARTNPGPHAPAPTTPGRGATGTTERPAPARRAQDHTPVPKASAAVRVPVVEARVPDLAVAPAVRAAAVRDDAPAAVVPHTPQPQAQEPQPQTPPTPATAGAVAALAVPQPPDPGTPAPPAESPLGWVVLAAARRPGSPTRVSAAKAQAAESNPIAEFLFNQTPTLNPTRTRQDSLSVVTGDLNINDPDSTTETYTVTADPARGTVSVDADGRYTYTPDAAYARIGTTDTFTVSVSDEASGFHLHGIGGLLNMLTFGLLGDSGHTTTAVVTVVVDPRNTAPEATVTVAAPDPATGAVTGAVLGTDADGDPLTFTAAATTAKGAVTVAADGTFTYTPTDAARHDAASAVATAVDKTDTFTVTVADNYGGTVKVPVSVDISPLNKAPVGGVSVDAPDPSTGRVTGRVSATDPDGDPLTYTGPTSTAKGSVAVAADGTFTYTPNAAARHNAAATSASVADKTDTFTVTVSDGSGGSTEVAVTVSIAPRNTAPVSGGAVAGTPNATTGVVTGSVTAIDADGDSLSYSASTPGKGSVTFGGNGSFTYTPSTPARQAAAAQGATDADKADAFTVTVSDGHGGTVAIPVSVTVAPAVAAPPQSLVSFAFTYGAGSGSWTTDARTALEATAASLASYFVVSTPVTITINVSGINSPSSGTLAYASTDFTGAGAGFYRTVVQSEIITGTDPNGASADASITYNWSYPWALGSSVTGSEFDFKAVALHELLHTVGILTGTGSNPASADRNWTVYDSFLSTSDGTLVIAGNYAIVAGDVGNFTGSGGGLYFAGPNAVAAYGGPVPLYTPGSWADGSSVSHVNQLGGYVMNPFSNRGLGARVLNPVEIAMLRDLGYTVRDTPLVYAVALLGLGLRRRRR